MFVEIGSLTQNMNRILHHDVGHVMGMPLAKVWIDRNVILFQLPKHTEPITVYWRYIQETNDG